MEILVCVKRVPTVGGAITLTADRRAIDTKASGFTISPHEECAVEEAVRLVERFGGSVTVVTLGPVAAEEQLRACLALGASAAVLLETGARRGDRADRDRGRAARGGGRGRLRPGAAGQRGVRHRRLPGRHPARAPARLAGGDRRSRRSRWPTTGSSLSASRTYRGVLETFALPLPCVVTVKEGINLPRYPSLPGRLRAKRAAITRVPGPAAPGPRLRDDVRMTRCGCRTRRGSRRPCSARAPAAVPALVDGAGGARGGLMTVFCLVELDGGRRRGGDVSLRALTLARGLAAGSAGAAAAGSPRWSSAARRRRAGRRTLAALRRTDVYVVSGIDGYAPQAWARAARASCSSAGRRSAPEPAATRWSRPGRSAATRCWPTWARSPDCRWRRTASAVSDGRRDGA